ncbi:hemicentin-1-like [Acanthopagrus latus]|uniref:hemicentin-1-like n=1 Tax=Acanthopagrus latus TaxID=8177 RepID=UPI00187C1A55|nr:hemicentin-1-like [Acanthopagrus latus]
MELLPLVCLCLLSCSGDAVRVVVEEDSDAVLPCLIRTKENLAGKAFDWKKDGQDVFFHDPIGHTNQGRDFTDRVSHFEDQLQNGNASIKITRTKMADSGNYSCIFPHLQSQTSIIELVVGRVLKDRTGENIPGAAPEPVIKILAETKHWRLLQCEAHGDPLPTVEWKDSDNNTLPADTPQISVRGGRSYITVKITVTKTGRYRCVATQEKFSHRIAANTSVLLAAVRVVVEEDSDAVLPCLISPEEDISGKLFHWSKDGQKVFVYDAGIHSQGEQFKGRVSFFQDQLKNGDASIKITRTKMADSGNYSCDFPRHQPRQTSIIELVVDPVLKGRTVENIPGLAPQPVIHTLRDTKYWRLLQCEARGVPPLTVEWKNGAGNILNSESTPKSQTGNHSSITLNINVTKTDDYSCVATQKQFSHQVAAVTPVYIQAVRVVVEEDSDAVLPCLISTKEDLSGKLFVWKKDGQKEKQVFTHDTSDEFPNRGQDEQFKGRVSVFQDQLQNGDASIKITRTKMADSGTYSCDFPRHHPRQTSIIELVVGRVLRDRTGENIPAVRVVVEEDSDAVLPCLISTEEDLSGKLFHWSKDDQNVFLYDAGVHSEGEQFKGRVSFFQDQLQNGDASIKITGTKKTDSGTYSCDFPRHQPRQTSIIELVVDQVLKDRTSENIPGASKPSVTTIKTDKGMVLQCEVLGASPKPKVEWKDSSGNILQTEEPQVTESGGRYDIVLRAAVTKTDTFRCVVTQEEISHQIYAEIYASVSAVRVVVEEDSDAVLPCWIRTKEDISGKLLVWKKDGAAPEPVIKIVAVTKDGVLLQCDARGVSPLTVELKNAAGNILNSLSTPISETGSPSSITLNIAVTKTDNYSCVATQKQFSHQVAAVIPVYIQAVRVVVEEDSDAVLPCWISTKEDITGKLLVWKKDGQKKMKKVFTHDTSDKFANRDQDEQFKGRVSVFEDQLQNGNASIKITGTKMADSGTYSCDFPRYQPRQTSIIELVVDPVLKDRRGEISGAAPQPVIKILAVTKDSSLLQCEARGVPRPTIKWQDSDNKTLPAEEPQISDRGGRFYITGKINVTKTNNYSCVATQETLSHQVAAVTSVHIQGSNTGWIIAGVFIGLFVVAVVAVVLYFKDRIRQICVKCSRPNRANGRTGTSERPSNLELLSVPDPAELIENHSAPV